MSRLLHDQFIPISLNNDVLSSTLIPVALLEMLDIIPSPPAEPLTVTGIGKVFTTSRNATRGEVAILEFVNSDSTPELSRQRVAPLLKSKKLVRDVQRLTQEGQMKFVDKIDRVGQNSSSSPIEIPPSSYLQRHIRPSTRKL